ncbi:hypothetical protein H4219_005284 [Mycoemilia scoparia]|uniref:Uncharacterized protein n=1 Tax=Mycoemilia scoparia TaxID=417184 RepID=A0A9W7ZPR0_9FUNG|nr:hypothetical protein H4219_005284 [Mycoemilia scoparia]
MSIIAIENTEANMMGSQAITPHDYIGMGADALANNPPSCGMPYATLDIGRITAVQAMDTSSECGTCLRVVAKASDCQASPALPYKHENGQLDVERFLANQATHQQDELEKLGLNRRHNLHRRASIINNNNREKYVEKRQDNGDEYRWVYVLAVDTGGQGLDMSLVSFSALFQQPSNPTQATWTPVDMSYCADILHPSQGRNGGGSQHYSKVNDIVVHTGPNPNA